MNTPTYEKGITALLVVDPYNDFISEGGKIWFRIKAVAEANNCVPHMLAVLNAARKARLRDHRLGAVSILAGAVRDLIFKISLTLPP